MTIINALGSLYRKIESTHDLMSQFSSEWAITTKLNSTEPTTWISNSLLTSGIR